MNKKGHRISYNDFILINLPAFLFLLGAILSIVLMFNIGIISRYIYLGLSWWCICGMVMLFIDYKRKRDIFLRLLSHQKGSSVSYPAAFRSTICGVSIILALKQRVRHDVKNK